MQGLARLAVPSLILAILAGAPAAWPQPMADSFEITLAMPEGRGHRVAVMLTTPAPGRALPGIVILPDEAGLDGRTARLADVMLTEGWVAIEMDPEPLSPDGAAVPPPPAPRRLGQLLRALHGVLRSDVRVDPERIAVLGLGTGGRGALHAAQDGGGPGFAAHAALYPGCAGLSAEMEAAPGAPALLLLPGAEEPEGACAGLGAAVLRMPGATYAWDHSLGTGMWRWSAAGSVPIRPDRPTTEAGEARLVSFLASAFSGVR
ncbi:dienelactone hydrolase family protein [Belnapia rosea]|uniref:dienelactone hydrolase family protein n=1 Tax=Belnapia rosea TaxID=938405 RepID=UPI000889EDEF|nr:hypothetical protein [Belnapia rosea]SDB19111.1 Dienelactone hydrolase [Belnapia rosea]